MAWNRRNIRSGVLATLFGLLGLFILFQPQDAGIDRAFLYPIRFDSNISRNSNFTVSFVLNLTNITQAIGISNFSVQNDSLLVCASQDGNILYDTDGNGVRNISDCVPYTIGT